MFLKFLSIWNQNIKMCMCSTEIRKSKDENWFSRGAQTFENMGINLAISPIWWYLAARHLDRISLEGWSHVPMYINVDCSIIVPVVVATQLLISVTNAPSFKIRSSFIILSDGRMEFPRWPSAFKLFLIWQVSAVFLNRLPRDLEEMRHSAERNLI